MVPLIGPVIFSIADVPLAPNIPPFEILNPDPIVITPLNVAFTEFPVASNCARLATPNTEEFRIKLHGQFIEDAVNLNAVDPAEGPTIIVPFPNPFELLVCKIPPVF